MAVKITTSLHMQRNEYSLEISAFFYLKAEKAENFSTCFSNCRIKSFRQIFDICWFTSYLQLNITYEFFSFTKNNSSTFNDVKNLSTEMNYTCLVTPQTKFQPPPLKGERKHSFLVSSYSIGKYETLVPNILHTAVAIVLKH